MKNTVLNLILLVGLSTLNAQNHNIELLGELSYQPELNDIWGYSDEQGNEYALVGTQEGVSVVDVTNPSSPVEVFNYIGPNSIWRDLKTYNDYMYVTNETSGGLLIVDLSPLPNDTNLPVYRFDDGGWSSAHNLYIDENGICYIFGANRGNGGAIMYDLNQDPIDLVEVGEFDTYYIHDGMARGDTLYSGHVNDGFFTVTDVSDKSNPRILGSFNTSYNFTHNVWISDDGKTLFTTDEKSFAFIGSYDISDPSNISELDLIRADNDGVIPHNAHVLNDYLITSYYTDGLLIHDVSRPQNMVETGRYDTSTDFDGNGFNGAWGVYPYLPSGNLLVSDIEEGLVVLGHTYKRAAFFEGQVFTKEDSLPLRAFMTGPNGQTELLELSGEFKTGQAESGVYEYVFYFPGYLRDTLSVQLTTGEVLDTNIYLEIDDHFQLTGRLAYRNVYTPKPLQGTIKFVNEEFDIEVETDSLGAFSIDPFFPGTYEIIYGAWGYETQQDVEVQLDENTGSLLLLVDPGYYDDFSLDYGWIVTGNAVGGVWEREEPFGVQNSIGEYVNPNSDIYGDIGETAFVTGNTYSMNVGDFDIDSGETVLISPIVDLSLYETPHVNFYRWLHARHYNGEEGTDGLKVYAVTEEDSVQLDFYNSFSEGRNQWNHETYNLSDYINVNGIVRFYFIAADYVPEDIIDVGIDQFRISEEPLTSLKELKSSSISIYPNPIVTGGELYFSDLLTKVSIYTLEGQLVDSQVNVEKYTTNLLKSGMYLIVMEGADILSAQKLLIK